MKKSIRNIILFLLVSVFLLSGTAVFAAGEDAAALYGRDVFPLLYPGEDDGTVRVCWMAPFNKPVSVYFGEDAESASCIPAECRRTTHFHQFGATWQYTASLPVVPNTNYVYSLAETGNSPEKWFSFKAGNAFSSTALFIADPHLRNTAHAAALENTLENALEYGNIDIILCAGDLMDRIEYLPYPVAEGLPCLRSIPFTSVSGNHDYYDMVYEYLSPPNLNETLGDFYFKKGNVLYIGLFSGPETFVDRHADFIRSAVKQGEDCEWTVLLMHFSVQSNGSHGKDPDVKYYRNNLASVISECDIDFVISGHDHEYNRSFLMNPDGVVEGSGGKEITKKPGEAVYITLPSSSGSKFYDLSNRRKLPAVDDPAEEALEKETGYLLADFSEDSVSCRVYGLDSGLTDSFILYHQK